jgi:hypothetical protein
MLFSYKDDYSFHFKKSFGLIVKFFLLKVNSMFELKNETNFWFKNEKQCFQLRDKRFLPEKSHKE